MNKFIAVFIFLICPLFSTAQQPSWIDYDQRHLLYPESEYLLYFLSGVNQNRENEKQFLDKLLSQARGELINSVYTTVQSSTNLKIISVNKNQTINTEENLTSQSTVQSKISLIGLKSEQYYDKKNKEAFVIVYTHKPSLIEFYKKTLLKITNSVAQNISQAQKYLAKNNKKESFKSYYACLALFNDFTDTQKILLALDVNSISPETDNLNQEVFLVNNQLKEIKKNKQLNLDEVSFLLIYESLQALDTLSQEIGVDNFTYRNTKMISDFSNLLKSHVERNISENTHFSFTSLNAGVQKPQKTTIPILEGEFWEEGDALKLKCIIRENFASQTIISKSEVYLPQNWLKANQVEFIPINFEKLSLINRIKLEALNPEYKAQINEISRKTLQIKASYFDQGTQKSIPNLPIKISLLNNNQEKIIGEALTNQEGICEVYLKNIKASNTVQVAQVSLMLNKYLNIDASSDYYQQLIKDYTIPDSRVFLQISGVPVYIYSEEFIFEEKANILEIEPQVKNMLSEYTFTFNPGYQESDYSINIKAKTRKGPSNGGLFFAYADVSVSVVDLKSGREIFKDNFTNIKGGGNSHEQAAIKALRKTSKQITESILKVLVP